MGILTIHALDPALEKRIRSAARKERKSLNCKLKELLEKSFGGRPTTADQRAEFAEFAGIWSEDDLREFAAATTACETVDKEDWQ